MYRLATLALVLSALMVSVAPRAAAQQLEELTEDASDLSKPWFPARSEQPRPGERLRNYSVLLGGLSLARARVALSGLSDEPGSDYSIEVRVVPSSFVRFFTSFEMYAYLEGIMGENDLIRQSSQVRTQSNDRRRLFRSTFSNGKLQSHVVVPAVDPEDNRVPVALEDYRESQDAGAVMVMGRNKEYDPLDIRQCDRVIKFFDGYAHSRIHLRGYDNIVYDRPQPGMNAIECRGYWETVGGQRPNRILEDDLRGRDPVRFYLAYDEQSDTLYPLRIQINHKFGVGVVRHDRG